MTAPMTYDIQQAADRIGPLVTVDYLRKHIRELPHCKSGRGTGRAGRVAFTEAHLAEIVQLLEKRPVDAPAPSGPETFSSLRTGRRRGPRTAAARDGASSTALAGGQSVLRHGGVGRVAGVAAPGRDVPAPPPNDRKAQR